MRFNLAVIEPKGYPFGHFLDDGIRLVAYGLESLGHEVRLQLNKLDTDRLNIVWGCHLLTRPEDVDMIAGVGPYVAVQTEVVHENGLGFNDRPDLMEEVYLPFLGRAAAIWDSKPTCLTKLRQLGLAAYHLPFGYHERMEVVQHKAEKDVDFSFFGSITPHRKMLFEAIQQRGYSIEVMFDARRMFRDDLVARTKIHLAPWQSADFNQLSFQRVSYLLCNRSVCLIEETPDQQCFEHCVLTANTHEFVERSIETVNRPDLGTLSQQFYEQFREIRMEDGLQRLLDESLSRSSAA